MASFLSADSRPGGPTIDQDLHEVANRVHEEFDDHLDPRVVDECLNQIAARFAGATVHTFIPLLVRRYVREELQTRRRQAGCQTGPSASRIAASETAFGESGGLDGVEPEGVAATVSVAGDTS